MTEWREQEDERYQLIQTINEGLSVTETADAIIAAGYRKVPDGYVLVSKQMINEAVQEAFRKALDDPREPNDAK